MGGTCPSESLRLIVSDCDHKFDHSVRASDATFGSYNRGLYEEPIETRAHWQQLRWRFVLSFYQLGQLGALRVGTDAGLELEPIT